MGGLCLSPEPVATIFGKCKHILNKTVTPLSTKSKLGAGSGLVLVLVQAVNILRTGLVFAGTRTTVESLHAVTLEVSNSPALLGTNTY